MMEKRIETQRQFIDGKDSRRISAETNNKMDQNFHSRFRVQKTVIKAQIVIDMISISTLIMAICSLQPSNLAEGLRITNFRVPAYVPISIAASGSSQHPLDLAKPILLDCDYEYQPEEDRRLTVRWFRNKEPEPFYQWLPELEVRHFADWIKPLLNQSFVMDPLDPMKRYRSLLIKRLSMNLTGQYTCLVSSLGGQESRQASLVVYQPPQTFAFHHRIYPAAAAYLAPPIQQQFRSAPQQPPPSSIRRPEEYEESLASSSFRPPGASPTQFRGYPPPPPGNIPSSVRSQPSAIVVRPPNNNAGGSNSSNDAQQLTGSGQDKVVYTHDGRPIRRKSRRQISGWMLRKRLGGSGSQSAEGDPLAAAEWPAAEQLPKFAIQLHHFQCQATQVTPRPVIVLSVKRNADSIAQYLHESSSTSVRPFQVNHAHYFRQRSFAPEGDHQSAAFTPPNGINLSSSSSNEMIMESDSDLMFTLYDITVSATVALNVSLGGGHPNSLVFTNSAPTATSGANLEPDPEAASADLAAWQQQGTVLSYRRGQRMSFECHLEITGTEFEQRKRININEDEVYQFAEQEERKRKLRRLQQHRQAEHLDREREQQQLMQQETPRPPAQNSAASNAELRHRWLHFLFATLLATGITLQLRNSSAFFHMVPN